MEEGLTKVKVAFVSLWDKSNIETLADILKRWRIKVISTGKTAKKLRDYKVDVIDVSEYTKSPEIMGGRVKSLHPKIYAGILGRRDNERDINDLSSVGAEFIDLVVVNLYPFVDAYKNGEKDLVEFVDIGGPTLLRAAAKNFKWVSVISSPSDYELLEKELIRFDGRTSFSFRKKVAKKVFALTSCYDSWIECGLFEGEKEEDLLSDEINLSLRKSCSLRYGENPHYQAGFYLPFGVSESGFEKISGEKELSFNNILDMYSAWQMVSSFPEVAAVVVKHNNPCGAAVGKDLAQAYRKAYSCDPMSSFGGIVGLNKRVDLKTAEEIISSGFRECVIAPDFDKEAVDCLKQKKNMRLVKAKIGFNKRDLDIRKVFNGFLMQMIDYSGDMDLDVVSKKRPSKEQLRDLLFAFNVVKFVKSNAIVLAKDGATVGIGAGQMSRVDAVWIAIEKAKEKAKGCVLASDAFFPKTDNIELAAKFGITAIIQPSGSKADSDVIDACDKYGIALVFVNRRFFKH